LQEFNERITLQNMKLMLIGAGGMLATDLEKVLSSAGHEVLAITERDVDITDTAAVAGMTGKADVLINCAAYTNVDGAESEVGLAYKVNADGAGNLARWCMARKTRMLHISTDYVFDGTKTTPYTETDAVCPLNIYGKSKLLGETLIRESGCDHLIIRTQSLFGRNGKNFVRTIMELMDKGIKPLKVVSDQKSCPTFTMHLSAAILHLLKSGEQGILNVSSSGSCSWFEFARSIAGMVRPDYGITPVKAVEFPRPAKRPAYSVLDKSRYTALTGRLLPDWQIGLREYLNEGYSKL
jgi:dTDP-4-dehydrorhamnose reductase